MENKNKGRKESEARKSKGKYKMTKSQLFKINQAKGLNILKWVGIIIACTIFTICVTYNYTPL